MIGARPQSPAGQGELAAALPVIERLRETIVAETNDIAAGGPVDYEAYSRRKTLALLELSRLLPAFERASAGAALRDPLLDLIARLEANRRALGVQVKAAAAVADIIARAIHDGQSDGTYTAPIWGRRQ